MITSAEISDLGILATSGYWVLTDALLKGCAWQGEEDALPRDIHALKMQAMHTFGSNKIFAASDFFTYQASALLQALLAVAPD